jgi:signal transduction histidine kinase
MSTRTRATHLQLTEERFARLSVLQELTVDALDLFDPDSPADPFLEHLSERLGCLAAIWVATVVGGDPALVAAAGISLASRALPIPRADDVATLALPYPELARPGMTRWEFPLREPSAPEPGRTHTLLLWFDEQLRPPIDHRPTVQRLVGVLRTVWTHRRLAEDLRRSWAELERTQLALVEQERLAAIGEMSAVIAHEVRNPLAVIFNCLAALEKRTTSAAESAELTAILRAEANRLNQMVSELLDFARPSEPHLQNESLDAIVADAIAAVRNAEPSVQSGAVPIELEILRASEPLLLDATLVRRALINLVSNAVQAVAGHGRVSVRVEQDTRDGGALVAVTNDGPGIPHDIQARMFEPFFTTKAAGTGLGLSVVKRAADAHHGDVFVRSEGASTTFVMRLPASAKP